MDAFQGFTLVLVAVVPSTLAGLLGGAIQSSTGRIWPGLVATLAAMATVACVAVALGR